MTEPQAIRRTPRDSQLDSETRLDCLDLRQDHAQKHMTLDIRLTVPDALLRQGN